ncbi:LAMI_0G12486g1_1 [Lachancea mirantina]|uniref:Small ribosomal subunit protein bS18m n=1 Tax=Lachancea mirantina TaxID=1230905 RepID=A0A1G4KBD2_9SACH|nr:LAMI_0G12486g1_1 [Lachancea mirantina]
MLSNFGRSVALSSCRLFSSSSAKMDYSFKIKLTPNRKSQVNLKSGDNSAASPATKLKRLDPRLVKKFQSGTYYEPFDFSLARLHLDKKLARKNSSNDLFDKNGVDPLDLYTNPEFLSRFVTSGGKILHRDVTGLSARNQRRLSKAIRRCQAIGLMSKTHRDVSFLPSRITGKL